MSHQMSISIRNQLILSFVFILTLYCNVLIQAKTLSKPSVPAPTTEKMAMVHSDMYDMIMPDSYGDDPSKTMQYQNFDAFFNAEKKMKNEDFKMPEETEMVVMVPAPKELMEKHKNDLRKH
uniref:Uncharacterized protein n=1 Tax=Glossina palpalis gambiensis TaxID=67801 RepID=A0A1B0AV85_9MUSC